MSSICSSRLYPLLKATLWHLFPSLSSQSHLSLSSHLHVSIFAQRDLLSPYRLKLKSVPIAFIFFQILHSGLISLPYLLIPLPNISLSPHLLVSIFAQRNLLFLFASSVSCRPASLPVWSALGLHTFLPACSPAPTCLPSCLVVCTYLTVRLRVFLPSLPLFLFTFLPYCPAAIIRSVTPVCPVYLYHCLLPYLTFFHAYPVRFLCVPFFHCSFFPLCLY